MKNATILLLPAILLLSLCWRCRKEQPDNLYGLPAATQSGAGTFGCLIDGKPWVAGVHVIALTDPLRIYYDEPGIGPLRNQALNLLAAFVTDSINDRISLDAIKVTKNAWLKPENAPTLSVVFGDIHNNYRYYSLAPNLPYHFHISKLDTIENICSGQFDCYVVSQKDADTLRLTLGRFDQRYVPE